MNIEEKKKLQPTFILILIILLAVLIRTNSWLNTPVIGADSAFFLWGSEFFDSNKNYEALKNGHHPLYSICISLLNSVIGNYETSGYLVSIIFSTLTILPLYFLTEKIFGKSAGLLCALLFAVHIKLIDSGSDIMTESTFIFFTSLALFFLINSFSEKGIGNQIWGGITSGLSFLTRPEGLILLVCFFLLILTSLIKGKGNPKKTAINSGFVLITFLLVTIPFFLFVYYELGFFWISTKTPAKIFSFDMSTSVIYAKIFTGIEIIDEFLRCIQKAFGIYIPLFVCLFFVKKKKEQVLFTHLIAFTCLFWIFLIALMVLLFKSSGYVGYRHIMILLVISLPLISAGVIEILQTLFSKTEEKKIYKKICEYIFSFLVFAILIVNVSLSLKPRRLVQKSIVDAGAFIKEDYKTRVLKKVGMERLSNLDLTGLKPKILATGEKIAYYAKGDYRSFSKKVAKYSDILEEIVRHNIDYFVIDQKDLEDMKSDFLIEFEKVKDNRITLAKIYGEGKRRLYVFSFDLDK